MHDSTAAEAGRDSDMRNVIENCLIYFLALGVCLLIWIVGGIGHVTHRRD
jgi:hypothetical protein